jgi:uncharacterized OB-fold protein
MTDERLDIVEGVISLPYRWSTGAVAARFLQALREKKILATRCPECKRVLVPARSFCPRCFVDTSEWLELPDRGKLRTYTVVSYSFEGQLLPPPHIIGIIELEGADVGLVHFVGGVDLSDLGKVAEQLPADVAVRAVWREDRAGRITDIEHFAPA